MSSMRYKAAGKIFGDVHEFMNKNSHFIVLTQMVKVLGKNLYDVTGREGKSLLPDSRETPDTGTGTR